MKLLARIGLLIVFIQAGGYLILTHFVHSSHQYAVLKEKKVRQQFSFSIKEFQKLKKEGTKEFKYVGVWYDIEKKIIKSDSILILAYSDKYEDSLKELLKSEEHSNQNKNKIPVIKSIEGRCLVFSGILKTETITLFNCFDFLNSYNSKFLKVDSPPPELV